MIMIEGSVSRMGDHIDTDIIIPARYLHSNDPELLARNCFADVDAAFWDKAKEYPILIAGKNFGCGSSREHAPIALKACGIRCIIAESYARIFYRNAINIGLPILVCEQAVSQTEPGDWISIDLVSGLIQNKSKELTFQSNPFPDFLQQIILAGGLVSYVKGMQASTLGLPD